ncbi:arylamine N-acetyltransferase [Archangium violaceum]|uniref:arylamine N-acetyltransferase family protein n=1 Tax=Archangium violaceum TaxID=83451 RepID=UPI002B2E540E|nr:arylamine N-acetyltransferase [Archangium violaceum]
MDIGQYFQRLGYEGPREPGLETLRALHLLHLESVPFENLDIHSQRPIVLDEASFFDKVVRHRRGGFCYELNGLFAALLRALGFQVTYLSGRVSTDGVQDTGPEFDHLLLEVTLDDGPLLVDVGFGDGFAEPLPLSTGQWTSGGQLFRLDQHGNDWALSRQKPDGAWMLLYVFSRVPRRLEAFAGMCRYHQTSPDSFFLKNRLCTRKTATGRVTLSGNRLIVTDAGQRTERMLGAEEFEQALLEHFGMPRMRRPE